MNKTLILTEREVEYLVNLVVARPYAECALLVVKMTKQLNDPLQQNPSSPPTSSRSGKRRSPLALSRSDLP